MDEQKRDYPRCATCRWWATDTLTSNGWGCCDLSHTDNWKPYDEHSKILAAGGPYGDGLAMTRPDFGCIQHEPR